MLPRYVGKTDYIKEADAFVAVVALEELNTGGGYADLIWSMASVLFGISRLSFGLICSAGFYFPKIKYTKYCILSTTSSEALIYIILTQHHQL